MLMLKLTFFAVLVAPINSQIVELFEGFPETRFMILGMPEAGTMEILERLQLSTPREEILFNGETPTTLMLSKLIEQSF